MKRVPMQVVTLRLDAATVAALEAVARLRGCSVSFVMRVALAAEIARNARRKKGRR
jgi:predicted transcriptional regulator